MRDGIDGGPLASRHEYAAIVNGLSLGFNVSPLLVYAIRLNETSEGDPPDILSNDGGHGIMQLTSSYPSNWTDPTANISYAIAHFIEPDWQSWKEADPSLAGDDLIRCIAVGYNAGFGTALAAHRAGDVDRVSYSGHYGVDAVRNYHALLDELPR